MKRLIDAEELKNKLRSLGWFEDDDESFTSCLEDIIDDAPTIDVCPMPECEPPKEECKFCKDNIFYNGDTFFIEIETGEWDEYYDAWKSVDIDGLKYCPYCGKELKESDYE